MEYLPTYLRSIAKIEKVCEEISTLFYTTAELKKKRDENRSLTNKFKEGQVPEKNIWMNAGDLFIKKSKGDVFNMIVKDQDSILANIKKQQTEMIEKYHVLLELKPKQLDPDMLDILKDIEDNLIE